MNWATNEPATKAKYSYTDADGFCTPSIGIRVYNVSVFMEDQKLQDSTFRPDANISRISQLLYVPGFPQLTLKQINMVQGEVHLYGHLKQEGYHAQQKT